MHFFEICPLDVIRDVIFPFLNYDERNAVNACMPRHDYIRTPLKKKEVLSFHVKLSTSIISRSLQKVEKTSGVQHSRAVLATYRALLNYYLPAVHNENFRKVLISKATGYSSLDSPEFKISQASKYVKKTLCGIANDILAVLENNPFKYHISIKDTIEWTAVKPYYYLEHPVKKKNSTTR